MLGERAIFYSVAFTAQQYFLHYHKNHKIKKKKKDY